MADISAITALDGVTYSIKDSEAREHLVPSAGTTGQVLTKTASGYGWADASGGGNVDTVNNIQPDANKNVQTVVELTQAQYDALVSPDPNVVYYITDGSTSYPTADDMRYQEGVSVADALDELNAGLTPEVEQIRADVKIVRMGKLRILYFDGCAPTSAGLIYTLSASDTPAVRVRSAINVFSPLNLGWAYIETDGKIKAQYTSSYGGTLTDVPTSKYVYGQIVWAV